MMGLIASDKGGKDFDPIKEGLHPAVCYGVIDLGQQYDEKWSKWTQKVLLQWELPEQRIEIEGADLPRATSRIFTLSLDKKSLLRPFLESWRGTAFSVEHLAGFDISKLAAVSCQLQILHNVVGDKTYANVQAAMPYSGEKIVPENPVVVYCIEERDIPESIPDWIKDKIRESKEHSEGDGEIMENEDIRQEPPEHGEPRDDIPF